MQDSVVLHPTKSATSHELCEMLKKVLSDSALFDEDPKIPVSKLFTVLPGLKKMSGGSKALAALVKTVESHKKKELSKVDRLVNSGNVTFDVLEHILAPGTKIVTERKGVEGMIIGGKVKTRVELSMENWEESMLTFPQRVRACVRACVRVCARV